MIKRINKYVALMCLVILSIGTQHAVADQVVYNTPKVGSYALDLCREWGRNCGKPAADAYCKSKGHKSAKIFSTKKDSPPTKIINGGGICPESYCDRISKVVCK